MGRGPATDRTRRKIHWGILRTAKTGINAAGKNVLVRKPIALTAHEEGDLVKAAQRFPHMKIQFPGNDRPSLAPEPAPLLCHRRLFGPAAAGPEQEFMHAFEGIQ